MQGEGGEESSSPLTNSALHQARPLLLFTAQLDPRLLQGKEGDRVGRRCVAWGRCRCRSLLCWVPPSSRLASPRSAHASPGGGLCVSHRGRHASRRPDTWQAHAHAHARRPWLTDLLPFSNPGTVCPHQQPPLRAPHTAALTPSCSQGMYAFQVAPSSGLSRSAERSSSSDQSTPTFVLRVPLHA